MRMSTERSTASDEESMVTAAPACRRSRAMASWLATDPEEEDGDEAAVGE
jgi:hypothetical protein